MAKGWVRTGGGSVDKCLHPDADLEITRCAPSTWIPFQVVCTRCGLKWHCDPVGPGHDRDQR